ncbi:aminotransferase class I/II-fold pyridoxal phosphate-dependent enzyme [Pseudomonas sp. MPC6]|uniref:DegT/DnrJ/EryC1/StrS family aminotransferase n=1 Tax=unclassified Pseudomonas TaxID=196821 RepID=UPI001110FA3C|nr:aminotransferase class I/II-fold pyridoxal phosphate-dependent enzyme [Pseudomonas sp. MPC6]QCY09536.1 aminotransferase class I/II-fold pyridoxal phosphate-dependent enzyme [Pseudomonas sp. MPC6]
MTRFTKSFTQQEPIPEEGIEHALEVMRSGRLHRYNSVGDELTETALLEQEFAAYSGSKFSLACASGGYALHIAMRAVGVKAGDKVLCNAFTLAPVPGAIHNAGAVSVLVETTEDYTIDLVDLEAKAAADDVHYLMLSHMRGHLVDMDRLMDICERHGICVIEDCAHTMGATWNGRKSGTFGRVGCFSTQTYKHINSGEGGLLITDDEELMAKAIMHSGSYMLYDRHPAAPGPEAFERIRFETPNYSGRMDNLRAAILRPQLRNLDRQCERWNALYREMEQGLRGISGIRVPQRKEPEFFVGSSIQFSLPQLSAGTVWDFIQRCEEHGVTIKWFGDADPKGYTSRFDSWQYLDSTPSLPKTVKVLETMCDMRLPLTFDVEDCKTIVAVIAEALDATQS